MTWYETANNPLQYSSLQVTLSLSGIDLVLTRDRFLLEGQVLTRAKESENIPYAKTRIMNAQGFSYQIRKDKGKLNTMHIMKKRLLLNLLRRSKN
jgi:hypothetical protein